MDSAIFSYFILYIESTLVITMQIILSDACNRLSQNTNSIPSNTCTVD
jgi:hypothetical protein